MPAVATSVIDARMYFLIALDVADDAGNVRRIFEVALAICS